MALEVPVNSLFRPGLRTAYRTRHLYNAAMAIEVSRLVQLSATRSSRVGYFLEGRIAHQRKLASLIAPVRTIRSTKRSYSSVSANISGRPVLGSSPQTDKRYAERPVLRPCQNGDEAESANRSGK